MTPLPSPSAQKAAGEIRHLEKEVYGEARMNRTVTTAFIQQAITEAVDAAVAPKDKRIEDLIKTSQALADSCQRYIEGDLTLAGIEDAIYEARQAISQEGGE